MKCGVRSGVFAGMVTMWVLRFESDILAFIVLAGVTLLLVSSYASDKLLDKYLP
jgi:hypothetical protein